MSEDADLTLGVGWVTSMAGIMKFSKLLLMLLLPPKETAQHHRTYRFMLNADSSVCAITQESISRKHHVVHAQH